MEIQNKRYIQGIYPLTPMQEGILFHSISESEANYYIQQLHFTIEGILDKELFEKSLNIIISRHDILRANYVYEKINKPQQVIFKEKPIKMYYEDLSQTNRAPQKAYIDDFFEKERSRGFNLLRGELIKLTIFKLSSEQHLVAISNHHIILDGWSISNIIKELLQIYKMLYHNKPIKLDEAQSFSKYINWLKQYDAEAALEYWKNYLDAYEQKTGIPKCHENVKSEEYRQEEVKYNVDKNITHKLKKLAKNNQVTLNTVIQVLWGILLQKYNNTDDAVFGSVVSGRASEIKGIEEMVGLFINTIPIRVRTEEGQSFKALIKQVHKDSIEAKKYEYSSLAEIQGLTELKHDLIDNIMVFENYPIQKALLQSSHNRPFEISDTSLFIQANYNLSICIAADEELGITLKYNAAVYDRAFISGLVSKLIHIINQAIDDPDVEVKDIEIITEDEKHKIIEIFNATETNFPKDKAIHQLFEEQAERTPDNIAVVYEGTSLTYKNLNEKANQLAKVLRSKGVKPDSIESIIVGLMAEKSLETIIGMIGILKAGGAYLPIDPCYPQDRIDFMLEDSSASILLTESGINGKFRKNIEVIELDAQAIYVESEGNPVNVNNSSDLAYIMYTSGSTGKPKGVLVEHKNVIRLVKNTNYISFKSDDRILQTGAIVFDASTFEIWGALLNGLELHMFNTNKLLDAVELEKTIISNKISILWLTSSLFDKLVQQKAEIFSGLRYLLVGGDVLTPRNINAVRRKCKELKIVNGYGPTENTTFSVCHLIDKEYELNIPIGIPISNTQAYIVDKYNKLCPIGVIGELCVAGDGLARGYLNRLDLTAEKFVVNPFKSNKIGYAKMYHTGDLARWLPDGNIEFLGRIDQQVKIRGFRIELKEIENSLLKHKDICEAVVLSKEDGNSNKYLCAYIVCSYPVCVYPEYDVQRGEKELTIAELREHLSKELPDYMIPAYFIQLDRLPLTLNGKVDYKALLDSSKYPEAYGSIAKGVEYETPKNEAEEKLARIWSEVLGIDKIGINDSFFMLGGDSIKAIQVCARLQKFNMKLEVKRLLQNQTIKKASKYVINNSRQISQGVISGEIDLTAIQKWFFEKNYTDMHHWNQSVMLYSEKGFNIESLRKAFDKIIEHHDILRAVYEVNDGKVVQINRSIEGQHYELKVFDLKTEEAYKDLMTAEANKIQSSLDIGSILIKLGLFKTEVGDHLLIVIHHLLIDGVSWRIIFEDLAAAYGHSVRNEHIVLPDKTHSFKSWSEEQYKYANSKQQLRELSYWKAVEEIETQPIPKDNIADEGKVKDTAIVSMELNDEETDKLLKKVNIAYSTEINDILLTALGMTLKAWSGNEKILINLEGHGRDMALGGLDITRTVGWFTAMYPVILDMSKSEKLSSQIIYIKEGLRRIPNKGIGYGILKYVTAQESNAESGFSKAESCFRKAQISFNYLGQFDKDVNTEVFKISNISAGNSVSPESERSYCLDVTGMVINNKLNMSFSYNKNEYNRSTMEALIQSYKKNLISIIEHCISKEEKELTPSDTTGREIEIEEFELIKKILSDNGIEQKHIEDIYPLSPMQEGMLFHKLLEDNSAVYFEQTSLDIEGHIDIQTFDESLNKVVEKYEVLRTIFIYERVGKPVQVVLKEKKVQVCYKDISELREECITAYIEEYKEQDKARGFNLSEEIALRVSVLKVREQKYEVIWSFHHIIMDGWCLSLIMKSFFADYINIKAGKQSNIEKVQPYSQYIRWLQDQDKEEAKSYWKKYLEQYEQRAAVPIIKAVKDEAKYENKEKTVVIDAVTSKGLVEFAQKSGVTLSTVMQAVWGVILQKYNNTNDVVFGAVVSGRPTEIKGIEEMVGLFINTIPVRFRTMEDETFEAAVVKLQKHTLEAKKYEYMSLAEIQSKSDLKQGIVDNIIVFENYPADKEIESSADKDKTGFKVKAAKAFEQINYGLSIVIIPDKEMVLNIKYNGAKYEAAYIDKVLGHITKVISTVIYKPNTRFGDLDILTEKERQQILTIFNDTKEYYPKDKTIQQLFEAQAEDTPDALAVVFENKGLTYKELNERANQLARVLKYKGVKEDSIVAVMARRSLEMITGIIGVLKAGGAYLPIDPTYPADRILYMLEDSNSEILLTKGLPHNLSLADKKNINIIDLEDEALYRGEKSNIENSNKAADPTNALAYVIYTSGSTGKPKGVMLEHKALNNFLHSTSYKFNKDITHKDVCLSLTSISFDVSVFEIFIPLINGAKLVLYNNEEAADIAKLSNTIIEEAVTLAYIPPVLLKELCDTLSEDGRPAALNKLLVGVEAIKNSALSSYVKLNNKITIINGYGPTEATICATMYKYNNMDNDDKKISIGSPIWNTQIYILDRYNKLCPIGAAGELCIAGDGLARGYLNRPELTNERFAVNPFEAGKRMYRTGDYARWLPDGNIEFLGRMDNQVKIRGYRIELGEIENKLMSHERVENAVVAVKEDKSGSKYLCAYLVQASAELNFAELKKYLSKHLPQFMIPSYFVLLDKLPTTSNGKIDIKSLSEINGTMLLESEYKAPSNEVEEKSAELWKEILGVEKIGINDNFFEMGGHSLKAMVLKSKLNKEFNIEVPLQEIFQNPTIKGISEYIYCSKKGYYADIEPVEEKEYYPVSSAQKRMYIVSQLDEHSVNCNMPMIMELNGKLNREAFEEAIKKLIARHESLRTSFEIVANEPVQRINKEVAFKMQYIEAGEKEIKEYIHSFIRPFDLKKAPLFRAALISLAEDKYILMLDFHHIITDGMSTKILIHELTRLCKGEELPELRIQCKDYAVWQKKMLYEGAFKTQEVYWLDRFKDDIPVLNMPTDYQRPAIKSYMGDCIVFEADELITNEIYRITRENKASLYMVLLAAYYILLYKYTGQGDLVVGTAITGRSHADIQKAVGMFVNLIAMRNHVIGTDTFKGLLAKVKENGIKAFECQDYPFEELIEKLSIKRDMSRSSLFDTVFEVQNIDIDKAVIDGLELTPYSFNIGLSKYDLIVEVAERDKIMEIRLTYSTALFSKATAEKIIKHYIEILNQIVEADDIEINAIVLEREVLSLSPGVMLEEEGDFRF